MNKIVLAMIFCFIIMLSSCLSPTSIINSPITTRENEAITVLFSDTSSLQDENSYYDALLELQQEYPEQIPSFIIVDKTERNKIKYYNITQYPTMLVLAENAIQLRLEGPYPKEEILTQLKQVFR